MPDLIPTDEQQAVIDNMKARNNLKIEAGAGSGKTTVLRMAAEATGGDILYLAYNKEAQKAAKKAFPKSVDVRTVHSLGWHGEHGSGDKLGRVFGHRIGGPRVPASRTAALLGIQDATIDLGNSLVLTGTTIARIASETVDRFCYGDTMVPQRRHVPKEDYLSAEAQEHLASEILPIAKKLWRQATDPQSAHRFTPDMYLKLFALSEPVLPYDTILLDEAQDSNGLTRKLVTDQSMSQLVAVGDSCQSIYGWRGASNILDGWPSDTDLILSRSWRFGQAIAEEANVWLAHTGREFSISGNPAMDSRVVTGSTVTATAILCRTNAMAMQRAMEIMNTGKKVAMAGGVTELKALVQAASDLMSGRRTNHPQLFVFKTWQELMAYTAESQGRDLQVLVTLLDKYTTGELLRACAQMVEPAKAEIIISTAHKAKGLEFDHVEIASDFKEPTPEVNEKGAPVPGRILKTDAMLAYVSVTRARHILDNRGLAWVHDRTNSADVWRARNGK